MTNRYFEVHREMTTDTSMHLVMTYWYFKVHRVEISEIFHGYIPGRYLALWTKYLEMSNVKQY